ncbi:hypothetical protein SCP_0601450 [Sparassis crispa]|uniref:Uncharacterized protein n=1 Tax=Sparassis crispa TaxID=139825 RepID=A0A401GPL9_9APHY|nr:hypothetical protein SCP_0601450 [Sparassis crispa]GBE84167.1 hypothetical protein SCP_0601450 [Sparassis crispa]
MSSTSDDISRPPYSATSTDQSMLPSSPDYSAYDWSALLDNGYLLCVDGVSYRTLTDVSCRSPKRVEILGDLFVQKEHYDLEKLREFLKTDSITDVTFMRWTATPLLTLFEVILLHQIKILRIVGGTYDIRALCCILLTFSELHTFHVKRVRVEPAATTQRSKSSNADADSFHTLTLAGGRATAFCEWLSPPLSNSGVKALGIAWRPPRAMTLLDVSFEELVREASEKLSSLALIVDYYVDPSQLQLPYDSSTDVSFKVYTLLDIDYSIRPYECMQWVDRFLESVPRTVEKIALGLVCSSAGDFSPKLVWPTIDGNLLRLKTVNPNLSVDFQVALLEIPPPQERSEEEVLREWCTSVATVFKDSLPEFLGFAEAGLSLQRF